MKTLYLFSFLTIFSIANAFGQINRYSKPAQATIRETQVLPDIEFMKGELEKKQRAHEIRIASCKKEITEYYNTISSYSEISNGLHNAYIMSLDNSVCESVKVEVLQKKVTKLIRPDNSYREVSNSFMINKAKTMIELQAKSGEKQSYIIYFLE